MKPETKETLKQVGNIAWGVTKFLAKMGAIYMGYNPNAEKEEQEEREREEAERQRRAQEREEYLSSLSPNERKLYDELQAVKRSNRSLQDDLEASQQSNEELSRRIRRLEPDD